MRKKLHAVIIMDGFGFNENKAASAVEKDGYKNIKKLMSRYPSVTIGASGLDVGLPDGQMGNSEVGHLNIGAGRIVYQELTRITKSIQDGDFFQNAALNAAVDAAIKKGGALHLLGLLSDGGVHSHIEHLYALVRLAKERGLQKIYIHCFLDGRDVSPTSGEGFIGRLSAELRQIGAGEIATVTGRYYAMDRDNRWERVQKAYRAMVHGEGVLTADAREAVKNSYANNVTDEFVLPTVVVDEGKPVGSIASGDSVIFFNFRPDRARQITRALTLQPGFDGFEAEDLKLSYVCLTQYDATFRDVTVAFPPQSMENTLGQVLAARGLTQLRIAETEKYAHVTFFFNGGVEQPNKGEDRILVPSPKVATYDLQPEMSAPEVTQKALEAIDSGKYDVMILNYANCDMVGHTGIMDAATAAVHTVDESVGKLVARILELGGSAIVTADHGNADKMFEDDGSPFTAHTTNPVPLILADDALAGARLRSGGRLADIAPTLLDIMGQSQPEDMTGTSLIER